MAAAEGAGVQAAVSAVRKLHPGSNIAEHSCGFVYSGRSPTVHSSPDGVISVNGDKLCMIV